MNRRPAVTLMEVLIAMFIMAIGMLSLLALFPVGAVSMAQALKDDRCAYASLMAENVAIVNNVRYGDANVTAALAASPTGMVYVDPYPFAYGQIAALPLLGTLGGVIPRVAPTFALTPQLADRWFSLPDDIGFNQSGTPDISNTGGFIDRGRRYSWAYLLRKQPLPTSPNPSTMNSVHLYAVVYQGRPVNSLATTPGEWIYNGSLGLDQTNFLILPTEFPTKITAKRGGWVLCNSTNPNNGQFEGYYFYRVTNLVESGTVATVELQTNLKGNVTQAIVMDYVAEVFDKGVGWQQ
jgi:hypothetical protein